MDRGHVNPNDTGTAEAVDKGKAYIEASNKGDGKASKVNSRF